MRLTDDKKLLEQVTVERFRQNLVLLQTKEIEIPRTWILELLDTIEALRQENEQLQYEKEAAEGIIEKYVKEMDGQYKEIQQLQTQNVAMRKGQPLFPNKLKEKCNQHGMTLRDVALKAGIAESTVYSLSACKVFPYPAWRQKIAKVFNCKESEIFAEVTND